MADDLNGVTVPRGRIIPPNLAVVAMRDSGYKSTAYALAELIDNAIQAKASDVEVICVEAKPESAKKYQRARISQIAVVDNGEGMDAVVLDKALQFGNGMRLADRTGIGRFGMGLPNASISQCKRVDVWTWQNGLENAIHSYLNVDEMESGATELVPEVTLRPVPTEWRERSEILGRTGTLVVWSEFDEHRLTWSSARSTLHNTEMLVGRIYRKFIDDGRVAIRLKAISDGEVAYDEHARVNDPIYLMAPSSTPKPFDTTPMFQPWGEQDHKFTIKTEDRGAHDVIVRISWARPETVPKDGTNRGATHYGRHAAKNIGVSVVRAARELDLDDNWVNSYDPVERWWGVEVEFPPELDEIFGVTNNKQAAVHFARMAHFNWEDEAEEGETSVAFKQRLLEEGDPRYHLIDITNYIRNQLKEVRKRLEAQTKGTRSGGQRHEQPTVDDRASKAFKDRAEERSVESDAEVLDDAAKEALVKDLEKKRYEPDVARGIAQTAQDRDRKVLFLIEDWESYAFFKVESKPGGLTEIVFNSSHPAYRRLLQVLSPEFRDEVSEAVLLRNLDEASQTLRMLFAAWARLEIEEMSNARKQQLKDMRQDWGQMAKTFLAVDDLTE
ncbi:ATP-binding protein [Phenylobacterium sp.]|uniref:ATP-binding protein n=1 Tax=Phenylobacterium sp. TaxID=1871053 RepID=UPI0035B4E664